MSKGKAWKAFSEYVRKRDCIKTTGTLEAGKCCSCGKIKLYSELDAGHYVSGRGNGILFDERCVHAQCQYCNRFQEGNKSGYALFMFDNYGRDVMDELELNKFTSRKYAEFDYTEIRKYYRQKIKELEKIV